MLLGNLKAASSALLLLVALGSGLGFACYRALPVGTSTPTAAPPTAARGRPADGEQRVKRLIAQLGSEAFADREAASRELARIGPPALDALREAAKSTDLEVRLRAAKLIPEIERRAEIDRLLTPTRIRLVYRETSRADAVADFSKRSGWPIELLDSAGVLTDRTLTLDTGDTTWWGACDALCRAAGLRTIKDTLEVQPEWVSGRPAGYNIGMKLTNGRPEALATDYAGAFRVQALSALTLSDGQPTPEGAHALALGIRPEPKVHCQSVEGVRITRAVDDLGQSLRPMGDVKPRTVRGLGDFVVVRLGKGAKTAKRLKELGGFIAVRASTGPRILASLDNVPRAVGRTAEGDDAVFLKILDLKQAAGEVTLRVQLKVSDEVIPTRGPGRIGQEEIFDHLSGGAVWKLVLMDAKGKPFPRPSTVSFISRGPDGRPPAITEYTRTFRQPAGVGEPTRLVFWGMRTVKVEVPFLLRDVPLR